MKDWARHKPIASLAAIAAVILLLIAAAYGLPHCCLAADHGPLEPPSLWNPLGTDRLGRSVLPVTISAAAYSIIWAAFVLLISIFIGISAAIVSVTWWEKWPDTIISSLAEMLRSFPTLVLALLFMTAGVPINMVLALYFWIPLWRVLRTNLGAQRFRPYILSSRLAGHSRIRTYLVHGLPNAATGLLSLILIVSVEILSVQAGLEFLGFVAPISRPTLGNVTSEALRLGGGFAWVWLPSALLASTIAVALVRLGSQRTPGGRLALE